MEGKKSKFSPCIIVHAGAWSLPNPFCEAYYAGIQEAAKAGYQVLKNVRIDEYNVLNKYSHHELGSGSWQSVAESDRSCKIVSGIIVDTGTYQGHVESWEDLAGLW